MSKNILVVDDSSIMRSQVISAVRELKGVSTFEASNGLEALKTLPQHPFDMMVLDIHMPEINGLEVLQFVKNYEAYKKMPIIIVSTDHAESEIRKGIALGANCYFIKPLEMELFQNTVRALLNL